LKSTQTLQQITKLQIKGVLHIFKEMLRMPPENLVLQDQLLHEEIEGGVEQMFKQLERLQNESISFQDRIRIPSQ